MTAHVVARYRHFNYMWGSKTSFLDLHVRIEKLRKNYVECLTYKNIVWPLSSYENQSDVNSKIISEKKVQVENVKVAKNSDDRVHHLTEFGLRIQGKNSSRARKEYVKNKINIYIQDKI